MFLADLAKFFSEFLSETIKTFDNLLLSKNLLKFLELSETIHNLSDIVINNLNYNKQKSLIKKKYNFSEKESKKLLDNILLKQNK